MATKPKPKPFSSLSGLPYVPGSQPPHPHWGSVTPSLGTLQQRIKTTKPKKKTAPKNVVSVEPNEHHKDMMCRPINQGDYVLAVQNNRPFPFKVVKLNATTVSMVPAIKTGDLSRKSLIAMRATGGSIPAYKNYRREGWNVYVIPKEEMFMYHLMGNL
jgi:hypothetical protein